MIRVPLPKLKMGHVTLIVPVVWLAKANANLDIAYLRTNLDD